MKKEKDTTKKWYQKKLVIIIGVILLIGIIGNALGGEESSTSGGNSTNPETKAQAILDKAEERFNKADYSGMIEKTEQITKDYPDTEVAKSIPTFIENLHNSLTKISSIQLVKEYNENEVNADNNYKGKLIIITGKIESIDVTLNTPYVRLSDGEQYSFKSVSCKIKNETQINKSASLSKGQDITMIGRVTGATVGSPYLDDCFILD